MCLSLQWWLLEQTASQYQISAKTESTRHFPLQNIIINAVCFRVFCLNDIRVACACRTDKNDTLIWKLQPWCDHVQGGDAFLFITFQEEASWLALLLVMACYIFSQNQGKQCNWFQNVTLSTVHLVQVHYIHGFNYIASACHVSWQFQAGPNTTRGFMWLSAAAFNCRQRLLH